jgi:hypothetical protein
MISRHLSYLGSSDEAGCVGFASGMLTNGVTKITDSESLN